MVSTQEILERAKAAVPSALSLSSSQKNEALQLMAAALRTHCASILECNEADLQASKGRVSEVMLDRLSLSEERIEGMARGIEEVALLNDPVGKVRAHVELENGLLVDKISAPLGVVAIIYESRPNVTSDAAALALKSGNVCILRGGKEAYATSAEIVRVMREALSAGGFDPNLVNIVEDTSRESARELMVARGYVDLLIPRGGAGLISACVDQAKVPCIQTGTGICHIYVDDEVDEEQALRIIENAKVSRPSVCNAAEVLLVHKDVAAQFLPKLQERLCSEKAPHQVELRTDARAAEILGLPVAGPQDFDTEFLDYVLAVAVVDDLEAALAHIAAHSTHHSDAILTKNDAHAQLFTERVDSAAVYVNASTRFTDGGCFGLGCEMGISTQKLHARGPMGLEELTSYKYVVHGSGQIR